MNHEVMLIVDLLWEHSRPLDQAQWKDSVRCTKKLTTSGHHNVMTYSVGKHSRGIELPQISSNPESRSVEAPK
jgi:hypothetical protein